MRRRKIGIVISVCLVALAIMAAFLLRRRAAPEPARLLPEADAYVYLNLKPLRLAGVIGKNPPPITDPDYAEFVRETGFQFERDLDDAAFAIHAAPRLLELDSEAGAAHEFRRYSDVFRGRFDFNRADAYFRKAARSVETYRDVAIYILPLEGRTVRVALLGVGIVAVSNTDGPQAIHFMIDRYKQLALPFGGPSLVTRYYRHVPFASLVWGIARVTNGGRQGTPLVLPGGFDLFFPSNTVVVGSVRYLTAVELRAEAFTASAQEAQQIVEQANAFLSIFRGLSGAANPGGTDPDVKALFGSLQVQAYKTRAVLTASMSPAFLKKMFTESPPPQITGLGALPEAPAPTSAEKPQRRKSRKK